MSSVRVYAGWGTSRLVAILIVGVVVVLLGVIGAVARRRGSRVGGLLNGMDNRWSTSKVSIVLWTIAILWAFVTLLVRYRGSAIPGSVPAAYFALLGIPSAGALGAKAITSQPSVAKTSLPIPTSNPLAGFAQIFSDDTGSPDLLDSQYFLFNLVLLGYFVASFFHIAEPKPPSTEILLPALPGSLLALAGVSTATYLGKKGLAGARQGPTNAIPPRSSLQVTADSDVSLPGGGTITLNSAGSVSVFPGVTYTSQSAGTAQTATGGRLRLAKAGHLTLAEGARITGPPGAQIEALSECTVLVSNGSHAVNPDGSDAAGAPAGGKTLPANGIVTLVARGELIVTGNEAKLALPEDTTVEYAGAGTITVDTPVTGTVSAGVVLGQTGIGTVAFPAGGMYVDATNPGPAQTIGPGADITLSAGVDGSPARSITLANATQADLSPGTEITLPAEPTPVGPGVKQTATTKTILNLPSGGSITIDPTDAGVAAHVPNQAVISAAPGPQPATVTATIST